VAADENRLTGPQLPQDFADLIACLNEAAVAYMLVGGYAVVAHGFLRTTQDFDIWLRADRTNAERVMVAMRAFGDPGIPIAALEHADGEPPTGFRFGRPPFAVDLLTSIQGVSFEEAELSCEVRDCGGLMVRVIGLDALLKNKRATGRAKDAMDVSELEALRSAKTKPR
jgi:hypothetical protein